MVRLHWVKVWAIKAEQVRASLDLAGILLKASWKRRLMCSTPGTAQKFSPVFISDSGATQGFAEAGQVQWGENQGHFRAKIHFSAGCVSSITAGNGLFCRNLCTGDLWVISYPGKAEFVCSVPVQPLSSSKKKVPSQQLNSKIISLLLPALNFSNTNLQLQRLWWKHFQMSCNFGEGSFDTGWTIQDTHTHTGILILGKCALEITMEQEWLHLQYLHEDTNPS